MHAPTGCCGVQTFPNTLQSDGLHFPCKTSPQRQAGFAPVSYTHLSEHVIEEITISHFQGYISMRFHLRIDFFHLARY